MKIKHYTGYGSVNAMVVKKSFSTLSNERTLAINVWGDNECGLDRSDDAYDVNQWLIKKVAKVTIQCNQIKSIYCNPIEDISGQEAVQYIITYYEN